METEAPKVVVQTLLDVEFPRPRSRTGEFDRLFERIDEMLGTPGSPE